MTELWRDFRFGARMLAKSPGFTIPAALLLAVGISANTLIFSAVDAWLLRPLPVAQPGRLARLVEVHSTGFVTWDLPYVLAGRAAGGGVEEVIGQGEADVPLREGSATERVRVHLVSGNFFGSLGVGAQVGRVLTADDERRGTPVAVLSDGFRTRRFGRDPGVVGRSLSLGGQAFTVAGVTGAGFNGLTVDTSPDVRVPAACARLLVRPSGESAPGVLPLFGQIFVRLRPGVSAAAASEEAERWWGEALREEGERIYPGSGAGARTSRLRLEPVGNGVSNLRAQWSRGLQVLMGGVALLLMMACANVAGLLLTRSAGRAQEMAVRLALGATRGRIVRQLLAEGLLLGLLGGVGGVALSVAGLPLLERALPAVRDRGAVLQPLAVHLAIDWRVLLFSLAVTGAAVVLFALWPAVAGARGELAGTVRGQRSTARLGARKGMVAGQVAVCTVLLLGAAVLVETLRAMREMPLGFAADQVVTFTVDPGLRGYDAEAARRLGREWLARVRELPGVAAAGIGSRGVMRGSGVKATYGARGMRLGPGDFLNCSMNSVSEGYFASLGMGVVAGREFDERDRAAGAPARVLVNQTFASRFLAGRDPVGERIGGPGPDGVARGTMEVIGVVTDAKYRSVREAVPPTVYTVFEAGSAFVLQVRTGRAPESLVGPVREALRGLDGEMPLVEVHTLREEVESSLWQERLLAGLSTVFGGIAVMVAGLGLFGALDAAVRMRTREIGVRVAVGAAPGRIAAMLGGEVAALVGIGVAAGLGLYTGAAVWLGQAVYGVPVWEPRAGAGVLAGVAGMAAVAVAPAVRRAMGIAPGEALRGE